MASGAKSVREYCLAILESGDLEAKLVPPSAPDGGALEDAEPGPALYVDRPVRAPELRMRSGSEQLPRPGALVDPSARAACLRRFAHHELMAVELFAWALLLWPDTPPALRRGWLGALADEQRHCRLYLERLHAHGAELGEEPLSDYFWKHVAAMHASPRGPLAFLAALGLTLEQANLDFTLLYRDAFREVGDEASARVSQQVHDEERGHVRLAARWLARLKRPGESEVDVYDDAVPFPLCAARAKGRRFDAQARRAAGLSAELIEHVRRARPDTSPREPR